MGQSVCRALTADSTATRNIQGARRRAGAGCFGTPETPASDNRRGITSGGVLTQDAAPFWFGYSAVAPLGASE
jgi:hypothetical protein